MDSQTYPTAKQLASKTKDELLRYIHELHTFCRDKDEIIALDEELQNASDRVLGSCIQLQQLFTDTLSDLAHIVADAGRPA